jgi:glutamate--cysteine ligase
MLELSRQGLRRRGYVNPQGRDESSYLDPLLEAAREGRTFAERLVHRFEHDWRGDMDLAMRSMCEEALS